LNNIIQHNKNVQNNAYIHATHGKRRIKGREVAIIAVLDGKYKKDCFSTPSCNDFKGMSHCQCPFTVQ
jgi:hypothetical protein